MAELLPNFHSDLECLRPFSSTRLVAFDLDGTLLPSELITKFQELSRSLRRQGVSLVVATGRALAGVEPLLENLALERSVPLILYNGSVVVENSTFRVLSRRTIPRESVRRVHAECRRFGARAFAYFFNDPLQAYHELFGAREVVFGWAEPGATLMDSEIEFNGLAVEWQPMGDGSELSSEPSALLIRLTDDRLLTFDLRQALKADPGISVTQSGSAYLEVRPLGSHKAAALKVVADSRGIDRREVLAIGDNDNDIEMLEWAGIGVAVQNGSERAKASADYISRHDTFAGVVEVLRLIKNAKRYFRE